MRNNVFEKKSVTANGISFEYFLTKNSTEDGDVYSIEIREDNGKIRKSCCLNDVARSEEKALSLFRLLSENTVCVASAPYVLDDLADSMTFC